MLQAPTFEVSHPKHPEVLFVFRGLLPHEGLSLFPLTKKEYGPSYLVESFTIACINWFNISKNGEDLPCTEENKRYFASISQNTHLINYLLQKAEELASENEREESENLQQYIDFEIGETRYTESSKEHQIDAGDPFHRTWCCKLSGDENVWTLYGQEPPCHICPRRDFQLTPINSYIIQVWHLLDFCGRNRGMQEEPLNAPSITEVLRYKGCPPESLMGSVILDKLIRLESALFGYRIKKKEKERKKAEMGKAKNEAAQVSRAGR